MSPPTRRCGLKSQNQIALEVAEMSPPTRRCGLKFPVCKAMLDLGPVTSYAEVWIEMKDIMQLYLLSMSPPTRRCGLKCFHIRQTDSAISSPPTRRCGLKSFVRDMITSEENVTSYAEVWIEMIVQGTATTSPCSHLLRGGVD